MANVQFEAVVKVDGVVQGKANANADHKDPCEALELLRGEARDMASQAVDNAKDALGCKRESQDGGEDHDLGRPARSAPQ